MNFRLPALRTFIGFCVFVFTAHPLYAQVLRCVDAQGNVTYTNTGSDCAKQDNVTEILPALTPQEKEQLDTQYQQALERKKQEQRLQIERQQAQLQTDAQRRAEQEAKRPPPAPAVTPAPPAEPSVVYVPVYPPPPRPHLRPPPAAPQPPKQNPTHCNVFRCTDGKGNTWPVPR